MYILWPSSEENSQQPKTSSKRLYPLQASHTLTSPSCTDLVLRTPKLIPCLISSTPPTKPPTVKPFLPLSTSQHPKKNHYEKVIVLLKYILFHYRKAINLLFTHVFRYFRIPEDIVRDKEAPVPPSFINKCGYL